MPVLLASAVVAALTFLVWPGVPAAAAIKAWPAVALAIAAARTPTPLARTVAVGLGLSAVGDALLERPDLFVPGLAAFLCAHVAYVVAFVRDDRTPAWGWAAPAYLWGIVAFVALRAGLGDLAVPVVVYMAVINTMMWRAIARRHRPGGLVVAIGAVVFATSDTLIAVGKFGGVRLPGHDLAIMLTYWGAQACLAWGATRSGNPPPG